MAGARLPAIRDARRRESRARIRGRCERLCVVLERAIPSGQDAAVAPYACNCCPVAIGTLRMPYATVTTNEEGHRSVPLRSMCMTRRVRDATPS